MPAPKPKPAAGAESDEDDDFDPRDGAPEPPKSSARHPVGNQGPKDPRDQDASSPPSDPPEQGEGGSGEVPRGQGGETPGDQEHLTSADRPKLGARVHPALKRTLKIAAAMEGRKEEALVEQALAAYLWQYHPELAAQTFPQRPAQAR